MAVDKEPINLVKTKPKALTISESTAEILKAPTKSELRLIGLVEAVPFKQRHKQFTDRQLSQYEKAKRRSGKLKVSDGLKTDKRPRPQG